MSYYQMDYSMTNPGTPGWQFAPVPGWGANPAAAGPRRVGVGGCGCGGGVGQDTRVATDIEGRYNQTSYGMVAAVGAGALLLGVFLGYVAGKKAQKKMTANRRRKLTRNAARRRRPSARQTSTGMKAKYAEWHDVIEYTPNVRWSTRYKNQLPDSAFLYVAPGGRKMHTKRGTITIPRSKRKLPVKDLQGRYNKSHLANAIARLGQKKTQVPHKKKLQTKAQRIYAREFGYAGTRPKALPRAA